MLVGLFAVAVFAALGFELLIIPARKLLVAVCLGSAVIDHISQYSRIRCRCHWLDDVAFDYVNIWWLLYWSFHVGEGVVFHLFKAILHNCHLRCRLRSR